MNLADYKAAMEATAAFHAAARRAEHRASCLRAAQAPSRKVVEPMIVRIIHYPGPAEWLRHHGFTFAGELEFIERRPRTIRIADIQRAVAEHFCLPIREMTSDRRAKEVSHPRQVAMFLAKRLTARSLPEIGRRFGDRDHTTIIHGIKQVEKRSAADPELRWEIREIEERLTA